MSAATLPLIVKRALYSSSGVLIARISSALAGIVLAHAVGPGAFGAYATVWALMEICTSLADMGLVTGLKRDGSRSPEEIPELLGNAALSMLVVGVSLVSAAFLVLPGIGRSPLSQALFHPLALASISALVSEAVFAVLQVWGKQWLVSVFLVVRGTLFLSGTLVMAYFQQGVLSFAWYHGILYSVMAVILAASFLLHSVVSLNRSRIVSQIISSVPYGMSNAVNSFFLNIPLLVLARYGSEESVGYLAVALRFLMLGIIVAASASDDAFLPSLFGLFIRDRSHFRDVCMKMQRLYLAGGVFVSSALYVCAEAIIITLQGEEYRPAVGILRTICWSSLFLYATDAPNSALTASDQMRVKISIQSLAAFILLVLSVPMAMKYGLYGVSIAKLLGDFALLALLLLYIRRIDLFPFEWKAVYPLTSILTVAAALALVGIDRGNMFLAPALFFAFTLPFWKKTYHLLGHLKSNNQD